MKIKAILLSSSIICCSSSTVAETVFVTLEKGDAIAVIDPVAGELTLSVKVASSMTFKPYPWDVAVKS